MLAIVFFCISTTCETLYPVLTLPKQLCSCGRRGEAVALPASGQQWRPSGAAGWWSAGSGPAGPAPARPAHPGSGSAPVGPTVSAEENTEISAPLTLGSTGPAVLVTQIPPEGGECSGGGEKDKSCSALLWIRDSLFSIYETGEFWSLFGYWMILRMILLASGIIFKSLFT